MIEREQRLPHGWHANAMRADAGDIFEIDLDLDALAPRATIGVTHRRAATGEAIAGVATALLETEQDVALIRAGGMIPMILGQALQASGGRPGTWAR